MFCWAKITVFAFHRDKLNETKSNQLCDCKITPLNFSSYDAVLDKRYGAVGSPEREAFRKEAYAYYMGQVIREARREEKITQTELGKRIGANKSYISRIENGLIDPTISTIYSIITALGLRIEIVRPVG